jgi:hypothetical protein
MIGSGQHRPRAGANALRRERLIGINDRRGFLL